MTGITGCIGAGEGVYGRGEYASGRGPYISGRAVLGPIGGSGRGEEAFEPVVDGNVDGRGITSDRPLKAPVCGVPTERDGGCVRAKEAARASGSTRCAGIDDLGMFASTMLGPRVIV